MGYTLTNVHLRMQDVKNTVRRTRCTETLQGFYEFCVAVTKRGIYLTEDTLVRRVLGIILSEPKWLKFCIKQGWIRQEEFKPVTVTISNENDLRVLHAISWEFNTGGFPEIREVLKQTRIEAGEWSACASSTAIEFARAMKEAGLEP